MTGLLVGSTACRVLVAPSCSRSTRGACAAPMRLVLAEPFEKISPRWLSAINGGPQPQHGLQAGGAIAPFAPITSARVRMRREAKRRGRCDACRGALAYRSAHTRRGVWRGSWRADLPVCSGARGRDTLLLLRFRSLVEREFPAKERVFSRRKFAPTWPKKEFIFNVKTQAAESPHEQDHIWPRYARDGK